MSSIRLFKSQIDKLKSFKVPGSDVIRTAIKRHKSNLKSVTQYSDFPKNEELCVYSVRDKDWKLKDSDVRIALFLHFKNPIQFDKQIQSLDQEISVLFEQYSKQPFIIEQ